MISASQGVSMRNSTIVLVSVVTSIFLAGCSTKTSATDMMNADPGDMALPIGTTSMRLLASHYTIQPGDEFYQCQRINLPADMHIISVKPVSPLGVHHQVLAIDPSPGAEGTSDDKTGDCSPTDPDWHPLFASGVGSPSLTMPAGVALKIDGGQQVVLDLHLFNATGAAIDGDAAIDVIVATDPTGYQIAGVPFVGNMKFTIGASLKVNGACTVDKDSKMFAVFPHMHQTGSHIKITAAGTTVWDQDYQFIDQRFGIFPGWAGPESVQLHQGDKITVECTYDASGMGKKFGDSSTDEMCFAISYVTPPITTSLGTPFCIF